MKLILITPEGIKEIKDIKEFFIEALFEFKKLEEPKNVKMYSINKVAQKLHLGHDTVKNLIAEGYLGTTADGKYIPQYELDRYTKVKNSK